MIHFNKEDLDQDHLVCFLHIPKTGGKTLWRILDKQKDDVLVWHGKFFKELDKPLTFFTILRDPVDRVISTYYYLQNYERDPLYNQVRNMSIKEFASYMSREDIENKWYPKKDLRSIRFRTVNLATRYLSGGDPLNLEKAKENLMNHFSVVGFTDMYSESLYFIKEFFKWQDISSMSKVNVTPGRPKTSEVPRGIIDSIKEMNQLDIELYEWAKQDFRDKIQRLDRKSKEELDQWKQKLEG